MTQEWLIVVVVLVAGALPLLWEARRGARRGVVWGAALLAVCGALGGMWWMSTSRAQAIDPAAPEEPEQIPQDGYVTSKACRSCHPSEYNTWYGSYHRTMTQPARVSNLIGEIAKGWTMSIGGVSYSLETRGETIWASWEEPPFKQLSDIEMGVRGMQQALNDPSASDEVKRRLVDSIKAEQARYEKLSQERNKIERQVVLMTGSHNQQVLWVGGPFDGELLSFPFLYLRAEDRWVPRSAVFVRPPGPVNFGPWNNNCIKCHTTHARPRPDFQAQRADSHVSEFGISCEACHGPAQEHLRAHLSPLERYASHLTDERDETIAQPERFSREVSSQICGQCHSVSHYRDSETYWFKGSTYRPGEDLDEVKSVIQPRANKADGLAPESIRHASFWSDGIVRVAGREFNGLIDSGCFQKGEMACTSCHQLHGADPNDQLKPEGDKDEVCTSCHAPATYAAESHTHHKADSTGARCQSCHMPYTVYGLLKAVRSHYIDTPSAKTSAETGRPNACNQCHIDKSLGWTAQQLTQWYGAPPVELDEDEQRLSAALLWLLKGDAGQRALAAWTMGWDEARAASGGGWQAPFLALSLDEPYDAVRYVIGRSLRAQPGYEDFEFDFVAPPLVIDKEPARAIKIWEARAQPPAHTGPHLLLDAKGEVDMETLRRLKIQRDNSPITLPE